MRMSLPTFRLSHIDWSKKLYGVAGVFMLALLAVGVVGAISIRRQSLTMIALLQASQQRAESAGTARIAIMNMRMAEYQILLGAADSDEERQAAVAAIRASSNLDESIQRLQADLPGDAKVAELARLLTSISPLKLQLIRAARAGHNDMARDKLRTLGPPMERVGALSGELVEDEQNELSRAVSLQRRHGVATIGILGALVAGGCLVTLVVIWFVGRRLSKPLSALESSMSLLATGDLTVQVPSLGGDEIGRTARAMETMVTDLRSMVGNIDSSGASVTSYSETVGETAAQIHCVVAKLQAATLSIRSESQQVLDATGQTLTRLRAAADTARIGSETSARNSQEIRRAAEEFTSFQERMQRILDVSGDLQKKTEQIGQFAHTIQVISVNANMLALNATIQASAAGASGRAFAVVADEMRRLARNSGAATEQIAGLTGAIRASIQETVDLLAQAQQETNSNVGRLLEAADQTEKHSGQSRQVHDRIQEIVAFAGLQEAAVSGINGAVGELIQIGQESKSQVGLLQSVSQQFIDAARELNSVVARFRVNPEERAFISGGSTFL
jgi:methyl-accepting chemotaxis protein